ncbi:zinc finger protein 62 homolog [Mercenaria mercenaria]|uniref:zinc finger protein 62 homolog n=1 Tax=Mercenaria mercenaria TaxID=6596 RepID=UPI00234EADB8|nr:zinc finger protein 62 homolog [Mercenaria mercenaria]
MSLAYRIKPIYSCSVCKKTFANPANVARHERIHTGENPYKCKICGRQFRYESTYSVHMVVEHRVGKQKVAGGKRADQGKHVQQPDNKSSNRQGNFECEHCGRRYKQFTCYCQHLVSEHSAEKHKLKPGYYSENTDRDRESDSNIRDTNMSIPVLNQHHKTTINSNDLEPRARVGCQICHRTFMNMNILKSHMRLHEIPKSSTKSLTSTANAAINNILHLQNMRTSTMSKSAATRVNNFKYPELREASISTESTNVAHSRTETGTVNGRNKPSQPVEKSGRNIQGVVNAMTKPVASKQHQSKVNDVTFRRDASYIDVETGSIESDSDMFGRWDSSQSQLSQSNVNNTTVYTCQPKPCPKCYKSFKTSIGLRKHMAFAHPKRFTCTICDLSFKTPHSCKQNEKHLYECSVCKCKFCTMKSLKKHAQSHKKCYKCNICKQCFYTKEEQTNHLRTSHIRNGPFTCPYCELSFTDKSNRYRHIKLHHKTSKRPSQDIKTLECTVRKSPAGADKCAHTCSQCNNSFSKEYLLRKHVMKVHWKEDNKVNKMKQMAVRQIKQNSGKALSGRTVNEGQEMAVMRMEPNCAVTALGCADNEFEHYICDTCSAEFTTRHSLTVHIKENHFLGSLHAEADGVNSNFSGKDNIEQMDFTNKMEYLRKKKIELNEAILRDYSVYIDILKPDQIDLNTNRKVFRCEVCSTTFTRRDYLVRHIKRRAYDHGSYLRKKGDITGCFQCDVCRKVSTERFTMLSHRQKHTKKEFRDAGAREDVYKSPDGKTIITDLELNYTHTSSTEHEVSSSTRKEIFEEKSTKTDDDGVTIYMNRADDVDCEEEEEEEPLYTARPYFPEKNKDTELVQNGSIPHEAANAQAVDDIPAVRGTIEGECTVRVDEQNIENNVIVSSANTAELMVLADGIKRADQIHIKVCKERNTTDMAAEKGDMMEGIKRQCQTYDNFDTIANIAEQKKTPGGSNNKCKIHTVESVNDRSTKDLTSSSRHINTITMQNGKIHIPLKPNEQPHLPEECIGSSATVTGSMSSVSSCGGDDRVCIKCELVVLQGQTSLRCRLCDQVFCLNCSGLSRDVHDMLCSNGKEFTTCIWWTCHVCRHLVPKFALLLRQLSDFEHIINNQITNMEQRLSIMRSNGKN